MMRFIVQFLSVLIALLSSSTAVGAADEFGYSPDGGLVSFGEFDYVYDSASRLTEVWSNGTRVVENKYDALGRRVIKRTPDATHTFVYDRWLLVVERIERSNGMLEQIDYWWGKDLSGTLYDAGGIGGLLYIRKNGCDVYVPLYDGVGNVVQYVDKYGTLVAQYAYDAFGNTIQKSGVKADELKMRFSTRYFDDEAGLYYFGHRFYSPRIARWLTRDPIEEDGGLNLYAYCGNNALFYYDKDGRAYFAYRPLNIVRGLGVVGTIKDDIDNVVVGHENLFFEDGKTPSNLGYFADGLHPDPDNYGYKPAHLSGLDDCIMRKAVARVRPLPYSLLGGTERVKYNCQDWAEDVLNMYYAIRDGKIYYPKATKFIGRKR